MLGASTLTVWKRRSSAASFSMYLRYSLRVVAPTHCNSPRLSAGLMMLLASIAPSAEPAPTMVCSSSMNRMTLRERRISSITALMRSSNWPRYFVPGDHQREVERDDLLVAQQFGHVAAGDFLRQPFGDGGLADAGLAEQHGVVLRAAAEHLDDALDLVLAPDDGVEFALLGEFGQVPAEGAQGRGFHVLLVAVFGGHFLFRLRRGEIGVEFLEDFVAGAFDIDFQALEHAGGDAFALAQQAEQDVLGADVGMVEALGLLARQREHFLDARRVRDVADHLGLRAAADLLFDFHAHGLHVETHLLQHVDGNSLAEFDQAEEQVLGPDVIMVEAVGLFPGQG